MNAAKAIMLSSLERVTVLDPEAGSNIEAACKPIKLDKKSPAIVTPSINSFAESPNKMPISNSKIIVPTMNGILSFGTGIKSDTAGAKARATIRAVDIFIGVGIVRSAKRGTVKNNPVSLTKTIINE